jgi:hypothetical protein
VESRVVPLFARLASSLPNTQYSYESVYRVGTGVATKKDDGSIFDLGVVEE